MSTHHSLCKDYHPFGVFLESTMHNPYTPSCPFIQCIAYASRAAPSICIAHASQAAPPMKHPYKPSQAAPSMHRPCELSCPSDAANVTSQYTLKEISPDSFVCQEAEVLINQATSCTLKESSDESFDCLHSLVSCAESPFGVRLEDSLTGCLKRKK